MPPIPSQYYYVTLVLLSFCSLVGLYVAYRLQRDVAESGPTTEKDVASPLEKAYAAGLMHEAEFRRIQESMQKLKAGGASIPVKRPKPKAADPAPIEDATTEGEDEATSEE